MSRILCVIDGMTDPHFQVERYGHLASMGSVRYVDTCGGFPPETLHCVLRLLGVTDLPVHLRGYVEALGAGIPVRPDDLLLRGSCYTLDGEGCCTMPCCAPAKVEDPAFTYYRLGGYQALLVFPHMAHTVNNIVTQIPSGGQRALCPQGSLVLRHAFERLLTKERCMLLWGQSVPVALPPFPQKSAVICGKELVKGIARLLHMASAYWGFVGMALHLGLHWGMFLGLGRKALKLRPSRTRRVLLPILGGCVAVYGLIAFLRRDFLTYMLVRTHFVFFDFSEPLPLFYLDYLAMMGTCIFLAYYAARFLRKRAGGTK